STSSIPRCRCASFRGASRASARSPCRACSLSPPRGARRAEPSARPRVIRSRAMADVNPGALPIGSTFHGRYQIVRRIKAGGMGAVYEVVHLETRRRRALKVMLPSIVADPALRARFQAEATVAADVHSEHVVEIFDAGVDHETGTPFLVMELLDGEELA